MNEMDAVDNILLLSDSYKVSVQGHSEKYYICAGVREGKRYCKIRVT